MELAFIAEPFASKLIPSPEKLQGTQIVSMDYRAVQRSVTA